MSRKDNGNPSTQADLLAHQIIGYELAASTSQIPQATEEEELRQWQLKNQFELIGQLAGTKGFPARNGEFIVKIALVQNGAPILDVAVAPMLDLADWAVSREARTARTISALRPPELRRQKSGAVPCAQ